MAFTVKNVVDDARPMVGDETEPYHWADPQIVAVVDSGLQVLHSMRPDALTSVTVDPPDTLESLYDAVPVRDSFRAALRYFVAGTLLQERGSDKSMRQQGADFLARFQALAGV